MFFPLVYVNFSVSNKIFIFFKYFKNKRITPLLKVYGSPEANEATGQLMKVNTLFPSKNTEKGTKGGIVILKLKKLSDDAEILLSVSYEDRLENTHNNIEIIQFEDQGPEYFANTGIRMIDAPLTFRV